MAWSIFNQPPGTATAWAKSLLAKIGAPATPGNVQFVYDWERSEGGGGKYNPLNQGPVPGQPQLTTTGSQYGGGAADYASYAAGLTGAADYLNMPAYAGVKAALLANHTEAARSALFASPWAASHYGYGSRWYDGPAASSNGQTIPAGAATGQPVNWFTNLLGIPSLSGIKDLVLKVAIGGAGLALAVVGLDMAAHPSGGGLLPRVIPLPV